MLFIYYSLCQVQNAVDYLKIIGALDEHENLTVLGAGFLRLRCLKPQVTDASGYFCAETDFGFVVCRTPLIHVASGAKTGENVNPWGPF